VREPELKLAKQLIDQIAAETFDPTQYHDDVRKRIQDDIQRKMEGQDISAAPAPAEPARIIDLMEALKASLGKGGDGKAKAPSPAEAEADDEERKGARQSAGRAPAEKGGESKRARGGKR
jgi:DNA end-binding protein Ku